jgi:hypothetical protein
MEMEKIKSYSSHGQDLFPLYIMGNKPGYWVDIGARTFYTSPFGANNTRLLYENGWQGLSLDIQDFHSEYKNLKNVHFEVVDCKNKEKIKEIFLKHNVPTIIDYLSHDIDESKTIEGLKSIDFNKYKFRCITIENASYIFGQQNKIKQREFLKSHGYVLAGEIIDFEDWWVHPDLVDLNRVKHIERIKEITIPFTGTNKLERLNRLTLNLK